MVFGESKNSKLADLYNDDPPIQKDPSSSSTKVSPPEIFTTLPPILLVRRNTASAPLPAKYKLPVYKILLLVADGVIVTLSPDIAE